MMVSFCGGDGLRSCRSMRRVVRPAGLQVGGPASWHDDAGGWSSCLGPAYEALRALSWVVWVALKAAHLR